MHFLQYKPSDSFINNLRVLVSRREFHDKRLLNVMINDKKTTLRSSVKTLIVTRHNFKVVYIS